MTDIILYISTTDAVDTSTVSAVICANRVVAEHHKELCFATNTAVLIENDVDTYKEIGLDGVYFTAGTPTKLVKETRKKYKDIQMGIDCELSKHTAMVAGESGIDFVAFSGDKDPVSELVKWWTEIMEIAVVANVTDGDKSVVIDATDFVLLNA